MPARRGFHEKLQSILSEYSQTLNDFFFVQVGSHDGVSGDPLHDLIVRFKWSGILVEPVKYLFGKLRKNYEGQEKLVFENVAISTQDGQRLFYRLCEDAKGLPPWSSQLGSFFVEVVLKHQSHISNIRDYLMTEEVECITINKLIRKHRVRKMDLLHIDTEGFDFEIIRSLDFSKMRPNMILYEHKHLTSKDRLACLRFLESQGYSNMAGDCDTFAR